MVVDCGEIIDGSGSEVFKVLDVYIVGASGFIVFGLFDCY